MTMTPPLFAAEGLARLEAEAAYGAAAPYPHFILDGLFNPKALRAVLDEWPTPVDASLELHDDGTFVRKKRGTTWKTVFGDRTTRYLAELAAPPFLLLLQKVTGISGLMPDPYLFGGGLHATASGGTLAVHADFNKHPVTRLDRRLNLLVYLNEGWMEEQGGHLELWDAGMTACVRRVLPVFNRTVLFSTTSTSFHGQPDPVNGAPDLRRRSIALYYYSSGRPEESVSDVVQEHSTLWQQRPHQGY